MLLKQIERCVTLLLVQPANRTHCVMSLENRDDVGPIATAYPCEYFLCIDTRLATLWAKGYVCVLDDNVHQRDSSFYFFPSDRRLFWLGVVPGVNA